MVAAEKLRAKEEADNSTSGVTFTASSKKVDKPVEIELDGEKANKKRWNETAVKKKLQEEEMKNDVKRFMKEALLVKQRHVTKEGATGDKGHKNFQ